MDSIWMMDARLTVLAWLDEVVFYFQNNFNNFITLTNTMITSFADSFRKMKKPEIHDSYRNQSQTLPLTVTLK